MFIHRKSEPAIYRSVATGAEFKFRQAGAKEQEKLALLVNAEDAFGNDKNLRVSYALAADDYYAAWLMEDFSGVEDGKGKPHLFRNFTLQDRAGLAEALRQKDAEFPKWFASHCEAPEKKTEAAAPAEGVVGPASLPAVQG